MYCLTSLSELFRLYGGVIIATEGLQNEGRCSCLQSLGKREVFVKHTWK